MSQNRAIVDQLLTEASSGLFPTGYVSELILPEVQSKNTTGKLSKYGTNHLRVENSQRIGRSAFRRVEAISRSTASYAIEGHGLEGMVSKEDYKNVISPYDAERDETMGLTSLIWTEKEKLLADTLADTSIMTQNVTLSASTDKYSDYLNSDPIDDFNTARAAIRNGCGAIPNLAVMDYQVWNQLRFHPQMLDALGFKQNRPGGLEEGEMAKAMGVSKVLIAMGTYESAQEGQTSSLAPIWGKNLIFAVVPEKAMPYQVSLGYMVRYAGEAPRQVYKYAFNNPPGATGILVEDNYDMLISNAAAGYLIKSCIA